MLAQWLGDFVGQMHLHKVSKKRLAQELGWTREYVSMILNGHRTPSGAEQQMRDALSRIVEKEHV